jgi:ribulose-phosphate 3-epimerase
MPEFDQILVMTVEPGFGGQKFMPQVMSKLEQLVSARARHGVDVWLQVDGGITTETIAIAAEAGADTFVAGSSVYGAHNVPHAIAGLRAAATSHRH